MVSITTIRTWFCENGWIKSRILEMFQFIYTSGWNEAVNGENTFPSLWVHLR